MKAIQDFPLLIDLGGILGVHEITNIHQAREEIKKLIGNDPEFDQLGRHEAIKTLIGYVGENNAFPGMNESRLRGGADFNFDNEKWCDLNNSDQLWGGYVTMIRGYFCIMFSGACIHSVRTPQQTRRHLKKLFAKYNLNWRPDIDQEENI